MKRWSLLLALVAASLVPAGCGQPLSSAQSLAIVPGPTPVHRAAHPDRGPSWMRPDASAKKALLYVSDAETNDVYVYDYLNGTQVGTLTGQDDPGPQCVDRKGDVFVLETGNYTTVEYKHGGTTIINTYQNGGTDAVGCSIDAQGDLAITNQIPGQITVYAGGKGSGATYTQSACSDMWPAGYDGGGNLYVEGASHSGTVVCELPVGATQMQQVSLSGVFINFPGSVQWDGKYITLTDQQFQGGYNTGIYEATESPSGNLSAFGGTELTASCNGGYTEVLEPYIVGKKNAPVNHKQGKRIVGGNAQCYDAGVSYWPYPMGGPPSKSFGDYDVNGISVSFK
jgi:hypothetical protein